MDTVELSLVPAMASFEESKQRKADIVVASAEKVPDPWKGYVVKAAPVLGAVGAGAELAMPYVSKAYDKGLELWELLQPYHPEDMACVFFGLFMCFFGGEFPALITAIEAYRQVGFEPTWRALKILKADFDTVKDASQVAVDDVSPDGSTMLTTAVIEGQCGVVRLLLARGADPNLALDDGGETPLFLADDPRIIDLLAAHGADVDDAGEGGETALMEKARACDLDAVRALLRNGAEPSLRDGNGRTALDAAKRRLALTLQVPPLIRTAEGTWTPAAARRTVRAIVDLLAAVEFAGSWARYAREPVVQLRALRYLCLAGRATAPANLVRCFGSPPIPNAGKARTRARRAATVSLPEELFMLVLQFWDCRARG